MVSRLSLLSRTLTSKQRSLQETNFDKSFSPIIREMSKRKGNKKSEVRGITKAAGQEDKPDPAAVTIDKNGDVIIRVHAKPGAKRNAVTDISEEAIGVAISAPPVEGEANTELTRYLAGILGARKSDVTLERGMRARHKSVVVRNSSVDEVLQKLRLELPSDA